jgi:hypothetical protein
VPPSTENQIEELCSRIRILCGQPFTPESEAELRTLAKELRGAIRKHVRMAKSSLGVKGAAIAQRDPDEE